ncbi:MAG TPA: peptide chain release factor N(5)-glutamine methyltransferase [Candidatus Binataceae bacterium]|nr:peptide chain release factor N(5)-glutamine methyltransferase [Candidatus Binataceae bacterium]
MRPPIRVEHSVSFAIRAAAAALTAAGIESARLDAEILAAAALEIARAQVLIFAGHFPAAAQHRFEAFVARRATREPLAYITGRKEFFSLEFEVNPAVLIPRPETETLVAAALETLRRGKTRAVMRVLELGIGSGAIAIALAVNEPRVEIVATDISRAALAVAARNAVRHGVADRIRFEPSDLWPAIGDMAARFDLVVSNPPYIVRSELAALAPEIAEYEPLIALDGGADGLDFYRRIAAELHSYLSSDGQLLVEVGADQAAAIISIFEDRSATALSTIKDLAGHQRVVAASFGG